MVDVLTSEQRRLNMRRITGKNTKPEMLLRRQLHTRGFRYRTHDRSLPGRPDLVLPKFRAVIFVHGCFWHRHEGCRYATWPASRVEIWRAKFAANVARDRTVRNALAQAGWRVAIVWECALRKSNQVDVATDLIAEWLRSSLSELEIQEENVSMATA